MARRPKPVEKIHLDDRHRKLRIILLAVSITVALVAFGIGVSGLLNKGTGWNEVEASPDQISCSEDLTLNYYFGASGASPSAENRAISILYTDATEEAYRLFYREGELAKLNASPNQAVAVDPVLYGALEKIERSGNRSLYLAPVYTEYDRVFLCENEAEASLYDPGQSEDIRDYVRRVAAFVNDPEMIGLELMGENRVMLKIAPAYLTFAEENGITEFLDFGWMKNGFIVDYIADILTENGYTRGYIASYDGFTRNLDASGQSYRFNLFDRLENGIYRPAVMEYTGPQSIVFLRNYPLSDLDRWHYFSFSGGRIVTAYVDPADGMSKSATDNLVAYSKTMGCADMLLKLAPVFIADVLQENTLEALADMDIQSVWFEDTLLKTTDDALVLTATEDMEAAGYQFVK